MNKILKATKLYQELKKEFEKGDPNSELNRACNSIDNLAVYAMIRYANQANDATDTNGTCAIGDVSTSTYFTDAEIKEFKEGSLSFPFIVYEGTDPNNVIEVSEIVSISGMADNKGTPTELTIYKHVKGKETERLVYRLVQ